MRGFVDRVDGFPVVGTAHTGAQAVAAVAQLRPDLLLLDLYLPDMFGLEVVGGLREQGDKTDVRVISAARGMESVRGAVRHGAVNYLLKPFGFNDLRARLEQYAVQRQRMDVAVVRGQEDIDRVLPGTAMTAGATQLPKGMSPVTAVLVETALRKSDTVSATECAELVGISRVSARRYLEHFVGTGAVEVSLRYGSAGRPERRYRWSHA